MESFLQKLVMVITQPLSNTSDWVIMLIKEKKGKPQEIQQIIYNWLSESQTGSNQRSNDMVGFWKLAATVFNKMSFT